MNIKISLAILAAFACMGSTFAGELYGHHDEPSARQPSSAARVVAPHVAGGELYPEMERAAARMIAAPTPRQAASSIHATGGELYAPFGFNNASSGAKSYLSE